MWTMLAGGGVHKGSKTTHVLEETPGLLPLSSGLAPSFTVCSNKAIRFRTLIVAVLHSAGDGGRKSDSGCSSSAGVVSCWRRVYICTLVISNYTQAGDAATGNEREAQHKQRGKRGTVRQPQISMCQSQGRSTGREKGTSWGEGGLSS